MSSCPALDARGRFLRDTWETPAAVTRSDERTIDVFVLDMNHGWPNLGHGALVHAVQNIACDLADDLHALDLRLRVVSCDVRRGHVVPPSPVGQSAVYVGTGGPGHLDPLLNDGVASWSQGVVERPGWEAPLFSLFDDILGHPDAALLSVCHTFGVMCRWLGIAEPHLRGEEKGGKSSGVRENALTPAAHHHPWFGAFAKVLPSPGRLRILDSRLFDLLPNDRPWPVGVEAIGFEAEETATTAGPALTMVEVARDALGLVPRVFGVNHHPEIVNRPRQVTILKDRLRRGDVTQAWYNERLALLTETMPDEDSDVRLRLTSTYTLLAPLRYHIVRHVRLRAEALGRSTALHEGAVLLAALNGAMTENAGGTR